MRGLVELGNKGSGESLREKLNPKIVKKRIKRMKRDNLKYQAQIDGEVLPESRYYLTQAGALFLEGKCPNMVLRDGKWIPKPEKKKKGSSKTSTEYPPKVLIDGKWVVKKPLSEGPESEAEKQRIAREHLKLFVKGKKRWTPEAQELRDRYRKLSGEKVNTK